MHDQIVIPVEQALVPFHAEEILSARLPDDLIAASMKSLCGMLKIDTRAQIRRILRDEVLARQLVLVLIQVPGGPQVTEMLTAKAIPLWLTGLQSNMVAPEKRPLILALKEEAMDVLYRHFFKIDVGQGASPPPPPPPSVPEDASPWEMLYRTFNAFEGEYLTLKEELQAVREELSVLQQWRARVEARQASESSAPSARGGSTQADPILSPEHLVQLHVLMRALAQRTGEPAGRLYRDLADVFGVADSGALPDSAWDAVLAWCWQRAPVE